MESDGDLTHQNLFRKVLRYFYSSNRLGQRFNKGKRSYSTPLIRLDESYFRFPVSTGRAMSLVMWASDEMIDSSK